MWMRLRANSTRVRTESGPEGASYNLNQSGLVARLLLPHLVVRRVRNCAGYPDAQPGQFRSHSPQLRNSSVAFQCYTLKMLSNVTQRGPGNLALSRLDNTKQHLSTLLLIFVFVSMSGWFHVYDVYNQFFSQAGNTYLGYTLWKIVSDIYLL